MAFRLNVLWVVVLALTACAQTTSVSPCGDGESVAVNGASYCVYKEAIVIVGGFDCPASMRFRMDFDNATVCGDHAFDNIDVPNDICARAFVPCGEMERPDGAVPDDCSDGNSTCSLPGAIGTCTNTGICVMRACVPGFLNCNRDPADGCERAEGDVPCGQCGRECLDAGDGVDAATRVDAAVCPVGFGDCDADPSNGCEASLNDINNCGACGVVCPVACASINSEFVCIDNID